MAQGCGSNMQSKSNNKLVSLNEEVATIEVDSASDKEDLVLEVPKEFLSAGQSEQDFEWSFIDEDGNVVDLQTFTNQFDLSGLDFDFFANGVFRVKLPANSSVQFIVFIIRITTTIEHPIVGLPPRPVGDPIIGVPPRPVGDPIIGLPPRPVGDPIIGLPPRPVGDPIPVIGVPPPVGISVMGLPPPKPVGIKVLGLPKPVGIKVLGLPAQNN